MRRISFLTVFLSSLAIAFVIAVAVRIHSYSDVDTNVARPSLSGTPPPSAAPVPIVRQPFSPAVIDASTPRQAAVATERARRREELLREAQQPVTPLIVAAQPASAPPTRTPTQAQTRVVPSAPSQRQVARIVQPTSSVAPPPSVGRASARPSTETTTAAKDPNSDTAPPQLISIAFDPPQVQDGEEARVILTAVDDLSGIRGISGTITSPTGKALQGFAGQREGDTNRYVGRFTVPKNGEEGLWRANIITMSDNASNSVTLSIAQGTLPSTAVLRVVSSQSDSTPPTLKSVRAEKRSMHIGEPNPIYIEAEDDKSGVNLVSAVFQSPNRKARIGAGCRRGESDIWQCELSLPSCIDCGDWQLEQVTLQDKANNLATFRIDNPIVASLKINIGGDSCDSEAPRLHSIVFDQNVVTLGRDAAVVTVTITASDDACGVEGVSGQYAGPSSGSGGFFPFQKGGDDTTWIGRIPLDPRAPRGTWRITSVQLTDKGHNLRIYYVNDPLLANAMFQVR